MNKNRRFKRIIVIILAVLVIVAAYYLFLGQPMSITLKTEYLEYIKDDGIITEVKINGPFHASIVELDSHSETVYDENGNVLQIINTYDGVVKKSLLNSLEPSIDIEVSDSVEYIYQFNFDETVTIKNGIIVP